MEGFDARARAKGYRAIAGVDEAGRGPLAGPVVAAAVILPARFRSGLIRDSKALSPAAREKAYSLITEEAISFSFALCTHEEIDRINIFHASMLAMRRAVEALSLRPDFLYVDGNRPIACDIAQETVVAGDARCFSVMAAGIVAKVTRDRMMEEFDREYPGYGFSAHKGYATREHREAIGRLGPCPIHRRSFNVVQTQPSLTFPPGSTRKTGAEAEDAACALLERNGISIVERNYRARGGEIDIVGRQGDVLVFVEVRYREGEEFGAPEESVGFPKRRKIISAAREYIGAIPPSTWKEARFDVVAVVGRGPASVIRHYPSAFDAKGKIL